MRKKHSSRSQWNNTHPSFKRSPYVASQAGRDVTWNDLAHPWRIFSPNRDIEKIPASLRSHISSPSCQEGRQVCHQVQESRRAGVGHLILTPVKLSSQP
ncbi:hypothetical protein AVEN_104767-1 [Araneus ventricosus]|uniref:Uncharacterized protein n=1 Tax=Araneus ventricosus TaxID=182803 RepID=A0A4Y2KG14_ARAVE|nr:hypothetical protein AVEN_104767-1 [Araneus ventricosus]